MARCRGTCSVTLMVVLLLLLLWRRSQIDRTSLLLVPQGSGDGGLDVGVCLLWPHLTELDEFLHRAGGCCADGGDVRLEGLWVGDRGAELEELVWVQVDVWGLGPLALRWGVRTRSRDGRHV